MIVCNLWFKVIDTSRDSLCDTRTSSATFHTPEVTKQSWKLRFKWPVERRGEKGHNTWTGWNAQTKCAHNDMNTQPSDTHANVSGNTWRVVLLSSTGTCVFNRTQICFGQVHFFNADSLLFTIMYTLHSAQINLTFMIQIDEHSGLNALELVNIKLLSAATLQLYHSILIVVCSNYY